jgi:hypothetical protein
MPLRSDSPDEVVIWQPGRRVFPGVGVGQPLVGHERQCGELDALDVGV